MGTRPAPLRRTRVALTLEQCWHRVPGGTASAAIGSIQALQRYGDPSDRTELELVGVAARHRHPAPPPWTPPVEVRHLGLPRVALYEVWHRRRWPSVESVTGPVDVIHVTGMAMPPPSSPLVVTVNDLIFLEQPELFTARGVRFFHRAIELTKRDAALVLCPSRAAIAECVANGFAPDRLRFVPYGIETVPVTETDVIRVRSRYGIEGPYVLWLGTVEPRKNLPVLLQAFERVTHDSTLVIAGGSGWNEDLDRIADRAGARVNRIGFVDEADKPALFKDASVFCLPSLLEGFGIPVLEAMVQGTAVITSAGTSTEELVGPDPDDPASGDALAGVLIDPRDVDALSAALQELLDDDERRTAIGEAGRRRAARYSWKHTAEALVDAYLEASA